jgi:phage terminase large subunit-like protein
VWGKVATDAYKRWQADRIVAEMNFGGAMVKYVIRSHNATVPFRPVTASRGKVVRAEPVSSLVELGKVRMAGVFQAMEDELCAFTTHGYMGENSPNRADAMVWAFADLFPELTKPEAPKPQPKPQIIHRGGSNAWMRT